MHPIPPPQPEAPSNPPGQLTEAAGAMTGLVSTVTDEAGHSASVPGTTPVPPDGAVSPVTIPVSLTAPVNAVTGDTGQASDSPPDSPVTQPAPGGDGAELLDELRSLITRYVVVPSAEALDAVTLWIAATHLQAAFQHAPRLVITGPQKRCGKSRLLDVVTETVHRPVITVNASSAAIFRSITDQPPTLLVDEADTLFGTPKNAEKNEDLRGLLNAGHQRNRPTLRVVGLGTEQKVQEFPTFAMAALAGIGDMPDTIMDRAIVVRMRRRGPGETVQSFRSRRDTPHLHAVRNRLAAWAKPRTTQAAEAEPKMPVEDRAADTWEPLVIVADLAAGRWPERARAACTALTSAEAAQSEDADGHKTRILVDIRTAFAAEGDLEALPTERLITALRDMPEAPWAEYGTSGLNARHLQLLLRDYGISSANIRFKNGTQRKGFTRNQFLDAWTRYCPPTT